ncbi:succinate dehydrogenase, hydrophobic membrane anchor protein [Sinimarinibacterium thermocellulolyticum]|uniref:Succinate dehydrogenase hydrophobic membrane anchor subunit n=1 Tax=Sinimarinibacterium thermocellulolyticum TaxID=3170016 RepID=A0ABV2A8K5_9GAMM
MSLRSPLSRARGLGSAKHGVHHFWVQRVSAVALIPLALWFVFSVALLAAKGGSFDAVRYWASYPSVAVTLVLFLAAAAYHSALGVQVVIEDYVAGEGWKIALLVFSKFTHLLIAVAGIFAVLKLALA